MPLWESLGCAVFTDSDTDTELEHFKTDIEVRQFAELLGFAFKAPDGVPARWSPS